MKYKMLNSITDIEEGIIAHQVNCRGVIGAGVSGAIIKKYPEVKQQYKAICRDTNVDELLGRIQLITPKANPKVQIANIFTQLNYGNGSKRKICYTNEILLVRNIVMLCAKNPETNVYIPERIGCGLAGGNWNRVLRDLSDAKMPNLYIVKRLGGQNV